MNRGVTTPLIIKGSDVMLFLNENLTDTSVMKTLAAGIPIYTISDFPELNEEFTKLLDDGLRNRYFKLLDKNDRQLKRSINELASLGQSIPIYCKRLKVYCFLYSLETIKYSVPILFTVDEEYGNVLTGHILVLNNQNSYIIKTLGINKSYSESIINDIVKSIQKIVR